MVPQKYADLGFEIARFGTQSKVLLFGQKPVFVFNSNVNIDVTFITHICDSYLKYLKKKRSDLYQNLRSGFAEWKRVVYRNK